MSFAPVVLGIDFGTGGVRACLFDVHGALIVAVEQTYVTAYPRPGWATQRPVDWWLALCAATNEALARGDVRADRVVGLALDAPCDILLTDAAGTPTTDALMWMDLRGAERARRMTATGDAVLQYCGGDVPAEWPLPKVLALKEDDPRAWHAAHHLVEQMTWLTWRLTGEWVAPLNSAAAKWHYRATDGADAGWPLGLMRAVALTDAIEKLPQRVVPMGGLAGGLTPRPRQASALAPEPPSR